MSSPEHALIFSSQAQSDYEAILAYSHAAGAKSKQQRMKRCCFVRCRTFRIARFSVARAMIGAPECGSFPSASI